MFNSDVAEVTKSLHSTGQMCDAGLEVLYTDKGALVLPAGYLRQYVERQDVLLTYHREGPMGLYTAVFDVKDPQPEGFTRPGTK